MIISLVYAMDQNQVIGLKGKLPWHIPEDLSYFKSITMGKPVVMGRKTHESIGRPLPGRTNIILSRNHSYSSPGCVVVHSIEEAVSAAEDSDEIMVIGGSKIFQQFLPLANRMYVTFIDAIFDGDVFFPKIDWNNWKELSRKTVEDKRTGSVTIHFVVFERGEGELEEYSGVGISQESR